MKCNASGSSLAPGILCAPQQREAWNSHVQVAPCVPDVEQRFPVFSKSRLEGTWGKVFTIFACTSCWWLAAVGVIMTSKKTVSPGGVYPHAFAFTSMTQLSVGGIAGVCAWCRCKQPLPPFLWKEVGFLLLYGILQGFEIALTNKALQYLTVSERTLVGSTGIFFMMTTAWLYGLERFDCLKVISGALLVLGGMLQGVGQQSANTSTLSFHLTGIFMQLTSMFIASQRWALVQFIMQRSPPISALGQISKLQLLARVMPLTGLVCIPLAVMFEQGAYLPDNVLQVDVFTQVSTVAVALTCMLTAELQLIKLLSAVAYNVLATIHQIPTVICGVVLRNDHIGVFPGCGFGCCIFGALVYARAHQVESDVASLQDQRRAGSDSQEPLLLT